MYKIYKKSGSDLYDCTDYCGEISLRSNISEISEELSFDIKYVDFFVEKDMVQMYKEDRLIFDGIVVKRRKDKEEVDTVTCFDFGWYLNKNEEVYQFNSSASECIRRICNDFDIPVGGIVDIPTPITEIKTGTLSDIIKSILEYSGKEQDQHYVWEFWEGKFWVEHRRETAIAYNTDEFGNVWDTSNFLKKPIVETSIEEMKNSIKLVQEEEKNTKVMATVQDESSIASYGRLQKVETITKQNLAKANNIANNLLKELNKKSKNIQVELAGNIDCKASKLLKFNSDFINDDRNFLVVECNHKIKGVGHTMELRLEVI